MNRKARVKSGPKAGKVYMARMTSDETKLYRRAVEVAVRAGHRVPPKLSGRLDVAVLALPPEHYGARAWDLDNFWKVLLDSLKRAGVVVDDKQFDHEEIFRGNAVPGGRMLVSIFPYELDACFARLEDLGLPKPWEVASLVPALPF